MINLCIHTGRLTKDIQLKEVKTKSGKDIYVAQFSLACDVPNRKDDVVFINFEAWGKQAEILAKYLKKGDAITIQSHEESRNYIDKNTNKKVYRNIKVVDHFHFVPKNKQQQRITQSQQQNTQDDVRPIQNNTQEYTYTQQMDLNVPFYVYDENSYVYENPSTQPMNSTHNEDDEFYYYDYEIIDE